MLEHFSLRTNFLQICILFYLLLFVSNLSTCNSRTVFIFVHIPAVYSFSFNIFPANVWYFHFVVLALTKAPFLHICISNGSVISQQYQLFVFVQALTYFLTHFLDAKVSVFVHSRPSFSISFRLNSYFPLIKKKRKK